MGRARIDIKDSIIRGNVVAGDLISNFGEEDVKQIVNETLLAQHKMVAADQEQILVRYTDWLTENFSTFTIPGLGVPLPIDKAWVRLKVMGDNNVLDKPKTLRAKLVAYHEWERLSYRDDTFDAEDVTELGYRVIVIGGPGSGKSTLLRRTTHQLVATQQKVVHIRLPLVVKRLRQGLRIEDALLDTAIDGSGIEGVKLKPLLFPPDCILADGLDECDPYREVIVEALARLASAWKETRVIISTRPIGYEPAQFSDWTHAELLPLDREAVEKYGEQIINAIFSDTKLSNLKAKAFNKELRTNKVASLAARSPLLLGFLLSLFLSGETLGHFRASIYKQIVEQWLRPSGREWVIELDKGTARRSLEIIGWLLLNGSENEKDYDWEDLNKDLGRMLERELGNTKLAAENLAEQCIRYWQETGMLEYLSYGTQGVYTFVHFTLGEYAAARYLAALDPAEINEWLQRNFMDSHWRETILLASGVGAVESIVKQLLCQQDPSDPVAIGPNLAAVALAEADSSLPLSLTVIETLIERLKSPVPIVAYESANVAVDIVVKNYSDVARLIQPLFSHKQGWTKLAAVRLSIACGDDYVDINELKSCLLSDLPETETTKSWTASAGVRQIWNDVIYFGVPMLAKKHPDTETVQIIERLLYNGKISMRTMKIFPDVLKQLGHEEIANQYFNKAFSSFKGFSNISVEPFRQADRAFLESVSRCVADCENSHSVTTSSKFFNLGALFTALDVYDSSLPDWLALAKHGYTALVDAVLKGTISALGIDREALKGEVRQVLITANTQDKDRILELFSILPRVPINIEWQKGNESGLLTENLLSAISHPSQIIAVAAAKLFAARPDERTAKLAEEVLQHGNDQTLRLLAKISGFIWGDLAGEKLLSRLEGKNSLGCRWLYEAVPALVGADDMKRLLRVLAQGLQGRDVRIVTGVAQAVNNIKLSDLSAVKVELKESLNYWLGYGYHCDRCNTVFYGGSCPECHIVPNGPQADLVRALYKIDGLTLEELLDILNVKEQHHEIIKASKEGVIAVLAKDQYLLSQTIADFGRDKCSIRILEAILSLEAEYLINVETELLALLGLNNPKIRSAIIVSIGNAGWISKEKAIVVLREFIDDEDHEIRNQAVKSLRKLNLFL